MITYPNTTIRESNIGSFCTEFLSKVSNNFKIYLADRRKLRVMYSTKAFLHNWQEVTKNHLGRTNPAVENCAPEPPDKHRDLSKFRQQTIVNISQTAWDVTANIPWQRKGWCSAKLQKKKNLAVANCQNKQGKAFHAHVPYGSPVTWSRAPHHAPLCASSVANLAGVLSSHGLQKNLRTQSTRALGLRHEKLDLNWSDHWSNHWH